MLKKLPRFNSKKVLEYVRAQGCLKCGASNSEPHHLPSPFGGSRRALDIVVPLCRDCHSWVHINPKEEQAALDFFYAWAIRTWVQTLGLSWSDAWSGVVEAAGSKRT